MTTTAPASASSGSCPDADPTTIEARTLPPTGGRPAPFAAFQARPFLLFWTTITLSLTGVWIRITAQGWLVYDLTRDEFLLGLVSFCQAAPVLVASPIAGAILDRVDRRRVLLAVQLIQGSAVFVLATLVALDLVRVWHVLAVAVVVGFASGFDWPARLSLVPALVDRSRLQSAVALNSAAFNGARVVGPAVAGGLIALVGTAACFYLNSLLYVPFVVVLATLTVDRALPSQGKGGGAWRDLLAGYAYIWRTPTIRGLLSVDIFPLAFGITYFQFAPVVARDVLGLGGFGYGVLLAANGIGSLVGSAAVAWFARTRRRGRVVIAGVGTFGLLLVAFAASTNAYLSFALILSLGLVVAFYATLNDTLLQTLVDHAYRGRVLAVYSMFWGLTPIGTLEAGFLARQIGVQWALAINGLLVASYVPFLLRFTPMRRID